MKIHIKNFQSHKDTTIELIPGVNALLGISDVGKSAVIKAIRWVVENSPSGDEFVSWWGGDTSVSLDFGDVAITRIRGKSVNEYRIKREGKKEQILSGFGQSSPLTDPRLISVGEALNLRDFNLHTQHQGNFLLSDGGGAVNRYINRILNMEVIDRAVSNIESDLKHHRSQIAVEKESIKRLEADLQGFNFLGEADARLKILEANRSAWDAKESRYNDLYDAYEEAKSIESKLANIRKIVCLKETSVRLDKKSKEIESLKQKRNNLKNTIKEIESIENLIGIKSKIVGLKSRIISLIGRNNSILEKSKKCNNLENTIKDIQANENKLELLKNNISRMKEEFDKLMPDVCPLCGRSDCHANHDT